MPRTYLYLCPVKRVHVQQVLQEDSRSADDDSYVGVRCLACSRIHLINRKTGRLIDHKDKE